MLTYQLDEKRKYVSLYEHIRSDVLQGKLRSGEKLPSKRTLASNLSVSVVTVQQAYDQLLAEGYIYAKERSGYFVADISVIGGVASVSTSPVAEQKSTYGGDFPFSVWAKLMREVIADYGESLLSRTPCDGDMALKRAIADYLYRSRGMEVDVNRIVVGAGAEYLYGVLVQILGRDKTFAVENPGYPSIARAYALHGAKCTPIPVHRDGVHAEEVALSGADVVHISPSHQFPTGAVLPVAERLKLIAWAREKGAYIVEDEYDSEFRLYGRPLQSMCGLASDKVIYVNTFSKSLAPSMRMGYMVLPPELYLRYVELFGQSASVVPIFEQKTLARMISGGGFERHINRSRTRYRAVREWVLKKLSDIPLPHVVGDTASGLHVTVTFDKEVKTAEAEGALRESGLRFAPIADFMAFGVQGYPNAFVVYFPHKIN